MVPAVPEGLVVQDRQICLVVPVVQVAHMDQLCLADLEILVDLEDLEGPEDQVVQEGLVGQ